MQDVVAKVHPVTLVLQQVWGFGPDQDSVMTQRPWGSFPRLEPRSAHSEECMVSGVG